MLSQEDMIISRFLKLSNYLDNDQRMAIAHWQITHRIDESYRLLKERQESEHTWRMIES